MLVLTRKIGERLCIGPDIVITVVGVRGGQISIGISAPDDIRIDREEVRQRIDAGVPHPRYSERGPYARRQT